jgi:hypothetical protein
MVVKSRSRSAGSASVPLRVGRRIFGNGEGCRSAVRNDRGDAPQLHDPGDELVLEAAVKGQADAIVKFNESHLREARRNSGVEVIRPGEALRRIEK